MIVKFLFSLLPGIEGFVGFEVFTLVVMKSIIFWDITPCGPLSVNRRFGGTYRLHLQGRRNKFSKKPTSKQVASRIICQPEIRVYIENRRYVENWNSVPILSYGRANGNGVPVFHLPSVFYINPDFRLADYSACHLFACWFFAEVIFSTLKMEAICSSETSVDIQRTTRRYIPEDDTLQ
jgi:hypothetical protein